MTTYIYKYGYNNVCQPSSGVFFNNNYMKSYYIWTDQQTTNVYYCLCFIHTMLPTVCLWMDVSFVETINSYKQQQQQQQQLGLLHIYLSCTILFIHFFFLLFFTFISLENIKKDTIVSVYYLILFFCFCFFFGTVRKIKNFFYFFVLFLYKLNIYTLCLILIIIIIVLLINTNWNFLISYKETS